MKYHVPTALAVALSLIAMGSPDARAQQATSFEQLRLLVKTGDTVAVTDSSGKSSKGSIAMLSQSSLQLLVDGVAHDMPEASVSEIRQRRSDSLGNGAKNGAFAGAAYGGLVVLLGGVNPGTIAAVALCTGLGAGVGVGIDALIVRTQVIYRGRTRPSSTRFNIAPVLRGGSKGIALSVSF